MEITYFALGVLSMVALIFVGIIVWGLFRVSKIERQIVDIKESSRIELNTTQRQFENVYRDIDSAGDNYRREFENVFRRFETIEENSRLNTDNLVRMMNDRYDDSIRYTDKRIDKSLNQKEVL
jgi:hypothetical protein